MMRGVAGVRWPVVALTALAVGVAACSGSSAPGIAAVSTTLPTRPAASTSTSSPPPPTSTTLPSGPVPVSALAPVPDTAPALGAAIAASETAIHDPATALADVPALGATEQRLEATLAAHPAWVPAVLAALPVTLRAAVSGGVTGDTELSAVPGPTPTAIPPWTVAAPRPAVELLADCQAAQAATGVPWTVLAAINLVETRMGRIVGPSSAGAQGPMQFLPATWARFGGGGDIHDAHDAIAAAARLLRANGALRDLSSALYHYNPTVHYVRGVLGFSSAMASDIRSFYAYYGWRVYVSTTAGTFLLPEGYGQP
jgi:hypothetical protein